MSGAVRAAAALVVLASLASCGGQSLEERVEQRDKCEAVGGQWQEWRAAWDNSLRGECILEAK